MIPLKIIQTSFAPTRNPQLSTTCDVSNSAGKHSLLWLCRCRSKSHASSSEGGSPPPEGDPRKQELLAKIAMIQAQKVRLTDYLDERSAYLSQFAEEASAEIDAIGEKALSDLDQASARILENIESRMQAFEESAEMNRLELAESDKELSDFQGEIESRENEGLFFKSLRQRTPREKASAKDETDTISEVTKRSAASKTRRNIYLVLICILAAGVADSFLSSSPDWRKIAILGAISVALLSQFFYEQRIVSDTGEQQVRKTDEGK
ncbi:hypothetical protein Nepgr_011616 [Nepenthes gracilis]|uniref:Uncharacterized protein n=1 Tax=Nepenthes gracilis TaxID=150966 RepID=A0AAD3SFG6_NEPGR|nr:hypothetical protein Nepgr_011616 [Nepenthes gracilis]